MGHSRGCDRLNKGALRGFLYFFQLMMILIILALGVSNIYTVDKIYYLPWVVCRSYSLRRGIAIYYSLKDNSAHYMGRFLRSKSTINKLIASMSDISFCLAQINPLVGAIEQNAESVISVIEDNSAADIIVFPELVLTGYPPEDLLLREELHQRVQKQLERIALVTASLPETMVFVGLPWIKNGDCHNAALCIRGGEIVGTYFKWQLPNYAVFDEKRYFTPGERLCVVEHKGVKIGVAICEDLWVAGVVEAYANEQVELVVSLNASPYSYPQLDARIEAIKARQQRARLPIVYVNQVGAQDELVFDGHSKVVDEQGNIVIALPGFETCVSQVTWQRESGKWHGQSVPFSSLEASLYQALVLGVRDYVTKNRFPGVVLGLSGGIDSALTLAIACDALGADKVHAVMMPYRYTADISVEDAEKQAAKLGCAFDIVSIESMVDSFMGSLAPFFAGTERDTTEENLQSRCRGVFLMALSNKTGKLVLTTGNKSEMAVGYATLYGDMAGGFDVLKDVPKTMVYRLSNFRNRDGEIIPQRVIDRPPSAELAPDQVDQDSLPEYDDLDKILEYYIEQDLSAEDIISKGFAEDDVRRVIHLVTISEHKRRQAAPGVKVGPRAFGRDRRYPITSGFNRK